ncbi:hypothetical protein PIROE2DRAFT_11830 [Piromyces sp. E2]|nr:hypothetical protein PIROE2DRAFT_11830 [Piromyces sp. E2]|eukprot:OUM62009.1 hypothetical protein PIROE2DRAFT_11830 [Piromyces sp. E2]
MAVIEIDNYDNVCVRQPDHEIVGVDKQYISDKNTTYCIKEGVKCEDKEQYKYMNEDNGIIFCNLDGTPISNFHVKIGSYKNMYVYKGESETEQLVHIETSKMITEDVQSYHVRFLNTATNKSEQLEMHFSRSNQCYYIYCNKDKDNESLIGTVKIEITRYIKKEYKIEISPMVDRLFLLSIISLIVKLETKKGINTNETNKSVDSFSNCVFVGIAVIFIVAIFIIIMAAGLKD